jgi:hypothetical protein
VPGDAALTLLDDLDDRGVTPEAAIFHGLIHLCGHAKPARVDTALSLLPQMVKRGLTPTAGTFQLLIETCNRADPPRRNNVLQLAQQMEAAGFRPHTSLKRMIETAKDVFRPDHPKSSSQRTYSRWPRDASDDGRGQRGPAQKNSRSRGSSAEHDACSSNDPSVQKKLRSANSVGGQRSSARGDRSRSTTKQRAAGGQQIAAPSENSSHEGAPRTAADVSHGQSANYTGSTPRAVGHDAHRDFGRQCETAVPDYESNGTSAARDGVGTPTASSTCTADTRAAPKVHLRLLVHCSLPLHII